MNWGKRQGKGDLLPFLEIAPSFNMREFSFLVEKLNLIAYNSD
jgi:hypothetical protein